MFNTLFHLIHTKMGRPFGIISFQTDQPHWVCNTPVPRGGGVMRVACMGEKRPRTAQGVECVVAYK